jgi:putative DNA primase/helicase
MLSIATRRNRRTNSWYTIVGVRDPLGVESMVPIPFDATETELFRLLARQGFPRPPCAADRASFLKQLSQPNDSTISQVVSAPGWISRSTFCTPAGHYSARKVNVVDNFGVSYADHRFAVRGTLDQWLRNVGRPISGNSNAMFSIYAFLAGPIMALLGMETAGFNFVGKSSTGKSTILQIGGSTWGGGGPLGFIRTWLSTRNGLDVIAAMHNECGLGLDEGNLSGETPVEQAKTQFHATYRLSGGEEKVRQTDQQRRALWRFLYQGSTEMPRAELALLAGTTVSSGQLVRMMELHAEAGRGLGVWKEVPSRYTSPSHFSDDIRTKALTYLGWPLKRSSRSW